MESQKNRTVNPRNKRSFMHASIETVYSVVGQIGVKGMGWGIKKLSRHGFVPAAIIHFGYTFLFQFL